MMKFDYFNGNEIPVENHPLSIFDRSYAGQHGEDGHYYTIHTNHRTHKPYAVLKENYFKWISELEEKGARCLNEGETAIIDGVEVRGMTFSESRAWDMDELVGNIDEWGNLEVNDTFDYDWYYEHCF